MTPPPMLPPGYASVEAPGVRGFAVESAVPWLRQSLDGRRSLSAWANAEGQAAPSTATGRGTVRVVPAPVAGPDGRDRWAIRHYHRGGAVAPVLGDRYLALGTTRPHTELHASVTARKAGVATPAVVAGACYHGGLFYRADLVTEFIDGARTLSDVLFPGPSGSPAAGQGPLACLKAAVALIDDLVAAGIQHADLNAGNILLEMDGKGPKAWVLDLDSARVLPPGRPSRMAMRLRLARSLAKISRASGAGVPQAWASVLTGGA